MIGRKLLLILFLISFIGGAISGILLYEYFQGFFYRNNEKCLKNEENLEICIEKRIGFLESEITDLKETYLNKLAIRLKEYLGCCVKGFKIIISTDNMYFYKDEYNCYSDLPFKEVNLKNISLDFMRMILSIDKIYYECIDEFYKINPPFLDNEVKRIYFKLVALNEVDNKLVELKEKYKLGQLISVWEEVIKLEKGIEKVDKGF